MMNTKILELAKGSSFFTTLVIKLWYTTNMYIAIPANTIYIASRVKFSNSDLAPP
jgi:hypothetical protein